MFPDDGGELICDSANQAVESIITADYGLYIKYWKCFVIFFGQKIRQKN